MILLALNGMYLLLCANQVSKQMLEQRKQTEHMPRIVRALAFETLCDPWVIRGFGVLSVGMAIGLALLAAD